LATPLKRLRLEELRLEDPRLEGCLEGLRLCFLSPSLFLEGVCLRLCLWDLKFILVGLEFELMQRNKGLSPLLFR
jgi:hypothetical protein